MVKGYAGKFLFVDLSKGEIKEETPDESLYRDYIGGFGIGARILYDRLKAGVDPLGPDNMLGFVTGPLTGTPAVTGVRYAAVGKSPITGGWGDSSSGGEFAPYLKFSGYDAVFFTGISPKPVYLLVENGKAELKDAGYLWGKDTYETEDTLEAELGKEAKVICIGPAGEKMALTSCIITTRGAAAGRSGLGAVMGSKKLKAVVAKGGMDVPLADKAAADKLRREHVALLRKPGRDGKPFLEKHHQVGTSDGAYVSSHNGDSPVKNWDGIGIIDLPDVSGLHMDVANANVDRRYGCWHCPLACQASLKAGTGEYKYPATTRRPEYETAAAFGPNCLNNNQEAIAMVNHICNSYGLDTISGGTIIAFATECYENGIITKEDTDGIELTWGNHRAMVAMTEKMAKREGLGDILADGVKVAAEKIGKGAEKYAVHIGGQELGMHDPKLIMRPGMPAAARYKMDPTPGRHTAGFGPGAFFGQVLSSAGLCVFGFMVPNAQEVISRYLSAVTGWDRSVEELLKIGERIYVMRHAFNLREGINPLDRAVHPRIIGIPPQKEGPLAGVTADIDAQVYWNLGAMDWDQITTKPSKKKLLELGLDDLAEELWPPVAGPGPGPGR
jgi:aldehyde:ferredoxin oxidoreductase